MKSDKILDAIGMHCPLPILRVSKKIQVMGKDEILQVLADDKGFTADIKTWCETSGNELLLIEEKEGEISAWIKKA